LKSIPKLKSIRTYIAIDALISYSNVNVRLIIVMRQMITYLWLEVVERSEKQRECKRGSHVVL